MSGLFLSSQMVEKTQTIDLYKIFHKVLPNKTIVALINILKSEATNFCSYYGTTGVLLSSKFM